MMKENMNIFEYAVRNKVRFPHKGSISVEDLWDLPVEELDLVYRELNEEKKKTQEKSLLLAPSYENELLEIQIEIVKYIFEAKVKEWEAKQRAAAKKEQKQKIMAIMAAKQDAALENSSMEDLQKMLDALEE